MPLSAPPFSCSHVAGWFHSVPLGTGAAAGMGQAVMLYPPCSARGPGVLPCGVRGVEVVEPAVKPHLMHSEMLMVSPPAIPSSQAGTVGTKPGVWKLSREQPGSVPVPALEGPHSPRGFCPEWWPSALPRRSPAPGRSVATATGVPESPPSLLLSMKWQLLIQVGACRRCRGQGNPPWGLLSLGELGWGVPVPSAQGG